MAVDTSTRRAFFTLDGVENEFDFTFRALESAPEDIKCAVTTNGTTTLLTYTTDYSVTINSNGVGGVVTLVAPATTGTGTLTVYRETTITQESDYDDYNQFPADTLEEDLDKRTMVEQELNEKSDRALYLPITSSGVSTELPVPVGDKLIGWNAEGTGLENKNASGAGASSTILRGTFTNANLVAGVLTVTHNKSLSAPYVVIVIIFNNSYKQIFPDEVTGGANAVSVDLTNYGVLVGTWGYLIL